MCVGVGDNKVVRCCSSVCCWCCGDRLVGMVVLVLVLWIGGKVGKMRERTPTLYPRKLSTERTYVLRLRPAYLIPFSSISQIKKWKLFSSKKIG